eukprot:1217704-Rhodomonas_salina.2
MLLPPTTPCPVLIWRMVLPGGVDSSTRPDGRARYRVLSSYAPTTTCPVLTQCVVLPAKRSGTRLPTHFCKHKMHGALHSARSAPLPPCVAQSKAKTTSPVQFVLGVWTAIEEGDAIMSEFVHKVRLSCYTRPMRRPVLRCRMLLHGPFALRTRSAESGTEVGAYAATG